MAPQIEKDEVLLVPSAVIVPDELRLDVGSVPSGMITLRGKPMLERIAAAYTDLDVTRVVAADTGRERIEQYVSRSEYDWTVVDVAGTESLADTVEMALSAFPAADLRNTGLYVNFADTLVSPVRTVASGDYVPYRVEDRTYRWTAFEIKNGDIEDITPKYERASSGPRPVFVGQFGISSADALLTALRNADSDYIPRFYAGLRAYLSERTYDLWEPNTWIDVGHLDTYHMAKKQFLNTREFNELHVDSGKNVITKRSNDAETLISEINWYNQVPSALQPYLPRIYDWSTDGEKPFVQMEYIGYLSLSDLQLYGSHGQHLWNRIFYRLMQMLAEFREFTVTDTEKICDALKSMYVDKTRRRLNTLRDDERFEPFFGRDEVVVNGASHPSLGEFLGQLDSIVEEESLLCRGEFTIIHGDLCLPNILYDPRNQIVKLIDPRGAFGSFTVYGDPRYDLAKLRHSFVGHYEHLINGQFDAFRLGDRELSYDVHVTDEQQRREARFDTVLEEEVQDSLSQIELIEALLFLSMVPLHSDSYERQLCMLSQGIEKITPFVR
ncbi:aminoglycoside phosphotransferase family protein [Halobellus rubicundus]|uniref:Aminoglycoside phosphotransferase family protein n=1 Tax=Halobellus rubicundus TaxID=2996466 RepID=A0ABD5MBY6_9EURY